MLDGQTFMRWIALVLGCALALVTWSACESTETGNPPVVDPSELYLQRSGDDVVVTGKEGAVFPGGSIVEVTDLGTGQRVTARSNADGSFELTMPNASDAGLSIRALQGTKASKPTPLPEAGWPETGGGPGASSTDSTGEQPGEVPTDPVLDAGSTSPAPSAGLDAGASSPSADAAAMAPLDTGTGLVSDAQVADAQVADAQSSTVSADAQGPQVTCEELIADALQRLEQVVGPAKDACSTSPICKTVATATSCLNSCEELIAQSSEAAVQAAVAAIEQDVCVRHRALGCIRYQGCGPDFTSVSRN